MKKKDSIWTIVVEVKESELQYALDLMKERNQIDPRTESLDDMVENDLVKLFPNADYNVTDVEKVV
jgi:hypothetical protein